MLGKKEDMKKGKKKKKGKGKNMHIATCWGKYKTPTWLEFHKHPCHQLHQSFTASIHSSKPKACE